MPTQDTQKADTYTANPDYSNWTEEQITARIAQLAAEMRVLQWAKEQQAIVMGKRAK